MNDEKDIKKLEEMLETFEVTSRETERLMDELNEYKIGYELTAAEYSTLILEEFPDISDTILGFKIHTKFLDEYRKLKEKEKEFKKKERIYFTQLRALNLQEMKVKRNTAKLYERHID